MFSAGRQVKGVIALALKELLPKIQRHGEGWVLDLEGWSRDMEHTIVSHTLQLYSILEGPFLS